MAKKMLVLLVLALSGSAFGAEIDPCGVHVFANTKKVGRQLKAILAAKKYRVVDHADQAAYRVTAGRDTCNMPIGCGIAHYTVYVYVPSILDPRPGMVDLAATYSDRHRKDAIADFELGVVNCPGAI